MDGIRKMNFEFIECFSKDKIKIEGLYEVHCRIFKDKRGFFLEGYNRKQFFDAGLTMDFVQDNISILQVASVGLLC